MTKQDKDNLLKALKAIDVKEMSIEHPNVTITKWYRFGNFNALQIASEIIKAWPEQDIIS